MILDYSTGKLPPNFLILGVLLILAGLIGMFSKQYELIILLPIAIPLVFIRDGIQIDTRNKRTKKYTKLFSIEFGKWESIARTEYIQIARVRQVSGMSVLSINRNDFNLVYKVLLMMPNERKEILSGEENDIVKKAERIASSLSLELRYPTKL